MKEFDWRCDGKRNVKQWARDGQTRDTQVCVTDDSTNDDRIYYPGT